MTVEAPDIKVVTRIFDHSEGDPGKAKRKTTDFSRVTDATERALGRPVTKVIASTALTPPSVREILEGDDRLVSYAVTAKKPDPAAILNPALDMGKSRLTLLLSLGILRDEEPDEGGRFPKAEAAAKQVTAMYKIFDIYRTLPRELAIVGTAIYTEHDLDKVEKAKKGERSIGFNDVNDTLPGSPFLLMTGDTRFDEITNRGALPPMFVPAPGTASIKDVKDGKTMNPEAGEDSLAVFLAMLQGKDVVFITNPVLSGEVDDRTVLHDDKYERRLDARRILDSVAAIEYIEREYHLDASHVTREWINSIFKNAIDQHFFLAEVSENGEIVITLTNDQMLKGVRAPF